MGFFSNADKKNNISILLISTETGLVQYYIEAPAVSYYRNGTISTGSMVILDLPRSVQVTSQHDQDKGIYLTTSSHKVTVIGQSVRHRSSDSFLASPIIRLTDNEYVYYGISVPKATVHNDSFNSSVLVVGTEDHTAMKLTVTQSVTVSAGNTTTNLFPGKQYSFTINRLQTVYMSSPFDLSGTKVIANKPVSVFSGHECGNVPWNISFCNYLIEQIPQITLWGTVFYILPLANKTSYTIKIVAAYNSTNINIYCNITRNFYSINEGEFINQTLSMQEYCAIHSNKKVLVAQFGHGQHKYKAIGDPMMTLVPSTSQYLSEFDFSTVYSSTFSHYVNIVVMVQYYQPNMIFLTAGGITRSLDKHQWVPIQINSITEAYATQVKIPVGITNLFHHNPESKMMVIAYGFAQHDSYGHIGGVHIPEGCSTISS